MKILLYPGWRDGVYYNSIIDSLSEYDVEFLWGRASIPVPILRDLWKLLDADISHVHWFLAWLAAGNTILMPIRATLILPQLLLLKATTRVVWTAHDRLSQKPAHPRLESWIRHIFVRFICDTVIIHCENADDILIDGYHLPEACCEKMVVIPHPTMESSYPPPMDRTDALEEMDLTDVAGTIYLHFGRMQSYKGTSELIKTFVDVADDDDRLILAGPLTVRDFVDELDVARDDPRILTHFGYVNRENVPRFFAAADVTVHPYQRVLTSGTVVLSMMYGRPIIAPSMGCIPNQSPQSGSILYGESGLADALLDAKEADLEAMGQASLEACPEIAPEVVGPKTFAVYSSLVHYEQDS